jgi:hypothetical protein
MAVRPFDLETIPLADARSLWTKAKRTFRVRIVLGVALLVLFAACLAAALQLHVRPTSYFAHGGAGIVVADFSRSIDPRAYRRTGQLLRSLADSDQRLGLVAFADDAYEMLPPGTRGDEVRPMLRYYAAGKGPAAFVTLGAQVTPWSAAFLGGTNISRGLALARDVLQRERIRHGSVLLVSDLGDSSSDVPLLTQEIGEYQRAGITLRVVPLFPSTQDLALFTSIAGAHVVLGPHELAANADVAERRSVVGGFPLWLALGGLLLLLGLGANEVLCRRLEWGRP